MGLGLSSTPAQVSFEMAIAACSVTDFRAWGMLLFQPPVPGLFFYSPKRLSCIKKGAPTFLQLEMASLTVFAQLKLTMAAKRWPGPQDSWSGAWE